MRKIYSLVLMAAALLLGTNAWAETRTAGTFQQLQNELSAAAPGDVIELTADIAYPASPTRSDLINIDKSITLDGKGHKITGYGYCNYRLDDKAIFQPTSIAINANHDKTGLNVTIKNLELNRPSTCKTLNGEGAAAVTGHPSSDRYYGIGIFDGVTNVTLEGCSILSSVSKNTQMICAQGSSASALNLTINNSTIDATIGYGYATYFLKPLHIEINNSTLRGYCSLYFKSPQTDMPADNKGRMYWYGEGNIGTSGTVVIANNSVLDARNPSAGESNDFAILALEDDGIDITLNDCDMNAEKLSTANQALYLASPWTPANHRSQNITLTLNGANSHIIGDLVHSEWWGWTRTGEESKLTYENGWCENTTPKANHSEYAFANLFTADVQVIISGGTYSFHPNQYTYDMHVDTEAEGYSPNQKPTIYTQKHITIPAGHTVQEIVVDNETMYRVTEDIQTSYNINQDVPEEEGGAGENPNTNFIVQETTTLNNNETEANYVLVKEDGGNATTLTIGKADADQTLTVTHGIDVQDNAQVIVKSGSALVVENGGVITAKPENIVIEADENGAASLLLSPTVTINQTPNLTVKMTAKMVGYETVAANKEYYWHRFALPVDHADTWEKSAPITTWLYGWDYTNNDWIDLYVSEMVPFRGYTLSAETNPRQDITYTFKGKLVGNANSTLSFSRQGYNFFGNSYTGYISILQLVDQLTGSANIDGSVWMWDSETQTYKAIGLNNLRDHEERYEDWQKEVAPMQTFILRLVGAETAETEINYAEAIWGNPRYGNVPAPAPARAASVDNAYVQVSVAAANGQHDMIELIENTNRSDVYESGYDASKYMNNNSINFFATLNNEEYNVLATDNLQGKTLSLQTLNDINYTMTFSNVEGTQYAIRDLMTNVVTPMTEGNSYTFTAQPNSTTEGRFVIVPMQNMPTDVETVETTTAVKGIYTIMGQYVGETTDWENLPKGVYVIDGVKVVK